MAKYREFCPQCGFKNLRGDPVCPRCTRSLSLVEIKPGPPAPAPAPAPAPTQASPPTPPPPPRPAPAPPRPSAPPANPFAGAKPRPSPAPSPWATPTPAPGGHAQPSAAPPRPSPAPPAPPAPNPQLPSVPDVKGTVTSLKEENGPKPFAWPLWAGILLVGVGAFPIVIAVFCFVIAWKIVFGMFFGSRDGNRGQSRGLGGMLMETLIIRRLLTWNENPAAAAGNHLVIRLRDGGDILAIRFNRPLCAGSINVGDYLELAGQWNRATGEFYAAGGWNHTLSPPVQLQLAPLPGWPLLILGLALAAGEIVLFAAVAMQNM